VDGCQRCRVVIAKPFNSSEYHAEPQGWGWEKSSPGKTLLGSRQSAGCLRGWDVRKEKPFEGFYGSLVISSEIPVWRWACVRMATAPALDCWILRHRAAAREHQFEEWELSSSLLCRRGWETELPWQTLIHGPIRGRHKTFARGSFSKTEILDVTLNGVTASSFTGITIPPGGVYVLARRNQNGDSEF
jgi:hypothetical protein